MNWYGWLEARLQSAGVDVALENMPDPLVAREAAWVPFIVKHLAGGEDNLHNTVVVGHSSGAVAAMRLAERHALRGIVLVSAYSSDLGYASERESGYFGRPWDWEAQQRNCGFIVQFASADDPFLPIKAQWIVRDGLGLAAEYHELKGKLHFFDPFDELLSALEQQLAVTLK